MLDIKGVSNIKIIISLLVNALALIITAKIVPGFAIDGFWAAVFAAIILGVLNTFIRPILIILTAPINILTLGLFTFVVNAVVLRLTELLVPGLVIQGWITAILAAIVLAVVSTALSMLLKDIKR